MINIINASNDPYFNMAVEEFLIKRHDPGESLVMLWQNLPTIVVGKHQNTLEEINYRYVKDNKINVVRRLSGGGAVYHDLGNLNFTFIADRTDDTAFETFARPIIYCLARLGVPAVFKGRNDITVDGKKISGNAQYFYRNRVLHHGTLLFDSDLSVLTVALKGKKKDFASSAVPSVSSRVVNIAGYMPEKMDVGGFKSMLEKLIFEYNGLPYREHRFTGQELEVIDQLVETKYGTWEWNFGESPVFNFNRKISFDAGTVSVNLFVDGGIIRTCRIYGDYFEARPVSDLESALLGQQLREEVIRPLLENLDVSNYIRNISTDQLMECIF